MHLFQKVQKRLIMKAELIQKLFKILALMKSSIVVVTPLKEKPIHIPSVPPTDPIIPVTSKIKYSCWTEVKKGGANEYSNDTELFPFLLSSYVLNPWYSRILQGLT